MASGILKLKVCSSSESLADSSPISVAVGLYLTTSKVWSPTVGALFIGSDETQYIPLLVFHLSGFKIRSNKKN